MRVRKTGGDWLQSRHMRGRCLAGCATVANARRSEVYLGCLACRWSRGSSATTAALQGLRGQQTWQDERSRTAAKSCRGLSRLFCAREPVSDCGRRRTWCEQAASSATLSGGASDGGSLAHNQHIRYCGRRNPAVAGGYEDRHTADAWS